jgi:hypothetical protein
VVRLQERADAARTMGNRLLWRSATIIRTFVSFNLGWFPVVIDCDGRFSALNGPERCVRFFLDFTGDVTRSRQPLYLLPERDPLT